jgi:hypothetical protein
MTTVVVLMEDLMMEFQKIVKYAILNARNAKIMHKIVWLAKETEK